MTEENGNSAAPGASGDAGNSKDLADRIREAALEGDFQKADALREELIRIDPMNLQLIVATGDTIEEQKTKLLDKDHLAIWQDLYEACTDEERNGLFYSLQPAVIETNKLLQVQGKVSNRLFFIDSGKVVLFYQKDEKNKVAVQLGRGDIVGEESFFEISLCSLSAATQSEVKLYSLTRAATEQWAESYPGLYEKLAGFCRRIGKSKAGLKEHDLDRRVGKRYPVDGMAGAVVLDKNGQQTDTYVKGGLSDIAPTGLCFDIKCSNQETARTLLAKRISLTLAFDDWDKEPLHVRGLITKVGFHLHNDYSVHVRFAEAIDEETFKTLPCRPPLGEEDVDIQH